MTPTKKSYQFIYKSPKTAEVLEKADLLKGHHDANVLIDGESGTGKEVLARYIHDLEGDSNRPFVAVNCSAFPDDLIESELFGHEAGAFTDAKTKKIGKFEMAHGGDIFLDEIGTLQPRLQSKLLRVIQEKEIYRLGAEQPVRLKFRVIAATNDDLHDLMAKGDFRNDLYYRLAVVRLHMPPLRDRKEDIEPLAGYFLKNISNGGPRLTVDAEVMEMFRKYSWPGNIRELENIIHSAYIVCKNKGSICADGIDDKIAESSNGIRFGANGNRPAGSFIFPPYKKTLENFERAFIIEALRFSKGNKAFAARQLALPRSTFYEKIDSLSINDSPDETIE